MLVARQPGNLAAQRDGQFVGVERSAAVKVFPSGRRDGHELVGNAPIGGARISHYKRAIDMLLEEEILSQNPQFSQMSQEIVTLKGIESAFGDRVVFLTVMTSKSPQYEDVPDQQTAKAWAGRFGFDPDKVVVATNLWAWTIPTHILYSPQGQTLYRSTGYLPAEQITDLLSAYMRDWERWDRSGERSDWMR